MLLRSCILITLFCLSAKAQDFTLTLPQGSTTKVSLNVRKDEDLTLLYQGEFLETVEASLLAKRLRGHLTAAYQNYLSLYATGELKACVPPSKAPAPMSFVFLHSFPASAHDRIGYDHPSNPGLLIQTTDWDETEVRRIVIHEALHHWCSAQPNRIALERWKEEGAADYLASLAMGTPSQLNITRYFDTPCGATVRGGSALWWMAYMDSKKLHKSFLDTIATLHLGLRTDLIHGRLDHFGDARCLKATQVYPYGILVPYELPEPKNSVPYWDMSWGLTEIRSTASADVIGTKQPSGYFIWVGPLPKKVF